MSPQQASVVLGRLAGAGGGRKTQTCPPWLSSGSARENLAAQAIARVAHLRREAIERLRTLATKIEPAPASLVVFGSFARGEAGTHSDVDVLAVRPSTLSGNDHDAWTDSLGQWVDVADPLSSATPSTSSRLPLKSSLACPVARHPRCGRRSPPRASSSWGQPSWPISHLPLEMPRPRAQTRPVGPWEAAAFLATVRSSCAERRTPSNWATTPPPSATRSMPASWQVMRLLLPAPEPCGEVSTRKHPPTWTQRARTASRQLGIFVLAPPPQDPGPSTTPHPSGLPMRRLRWSAAERMAIIAREVVTSSGAAATGQKPEIDQ